jgi:hypothetical protein
MLGGGLNDAIEPAVRQQLTWFERIAVSEILVFTQCIEVSHGNAMTTPADVGRCLLGNRSWIDNLITVGGPFRF